MKATLENENFNLVLWFDKITCVTRGPYHSIKDEIVIPLKVTQPAFQLQTSPWLTFLLKYIGAVILAQEFGNTAQADTSTSSTISCQNHLGCKCLPKWMIYTVAGKKRKQCENIEKSDCMVVERSKFKMRCRRSNKKTKQSPCIFHGYEDRYVT